MLVVNQFMCFKNTNHFKDFTSKCYLKQWLYSHVFSKESEFAWKNFGIETIL